MLSPQLASFSLVYGRVESQPGALHALNTLVQDCDIYLFCKTTKLSLERVDTVPAIGVSEYWKLSMSRERCGYFGHLDNELF